MGISPGSIVSSRQSAGSQAKRLTARLVMHSSVMFTDSRPAQSKMHHRRSQPQVAAACSAQVTLQHVNTLMDAKVQDAAPCAASLHLAMALEPFPHVCLEERRQVCPARLGRWPAAHLTWLCLPSGQATTSKDRAELCGSLAQLCMQARPRHQHQVLCS